MTNRNIANLKRLFILLISVVMMVLSFNACVKKKPINNTETPQITEKPTQTPSQNPTQTPVPETTSMPSGEKITITYLDVGQGDSAFIELPEGKTMLIDASESKASDDIISFISGKGYKKIDYLVATHPHADHIGGMKEVIESFDIGEIYMPKASTNTKTYEKLLLAIADKGKKIKAASAGMTICEGVDILAPNADKYEDLNNYSVVIKITNGNHKFLFMGDAETISENEIMNAGFDVSADVIKVGHHGSGTSSGTNFVKATGAKYAVFSVGEGNSYNHPHTFIVERWQNAGATILRTDLNGNITVISDGANINVTTEK